MSDYHNSAPHVIDRRDEYPIFLHSELDDFPLTPEAFRVYAHLSRRAGREHTAYPSYATIGSACFAAMMRTEKRGRETVRVSKPMSASRQRLLAMQAIEELVECRLIEVEARYSPSGDRTSNLYILLPKTVWVRGGGLHGDPPPEGGGGLHGELGVDRGADHGGLHGDPKGIPIKGNPIEEREEGDNRQQEPESLSPVNPEQQTASLEPESLGQDPPSGGAPPRTAQRRTEAPGLLASRHLYPEMEAVGLGDLWVGQTMRKPQAYRAFKDELVVVVVGHLKARNLPCQQGDGINCILNAIRNQEWGKLSGWAETASQLVAKGARSPATQSADGMSHEQREAYMAEQFARQWQSRQANSTKPTHATTETLHAS